MTKEERKEYNRLYYLKNKDKTLERVKQYQQEHKDEIAEYQKEYHKEYNKQYYQDNKDKLLERVKQYQQTPIGRACYLVCGYKKSDKKHNRGECTVTPQWIIDNIFTSKCHYCEETDWTELGCDRIDNSKPHTPDNVVCCCEECNIKRGTKTYEEFLKITKAPVAYV